MIFRFKEVNETIFGENSIIFKTLSNVYAKHNDFKYIMYNNDIEKGWYILRII